MTGTISIDAKGTYINSIPSIDDDRPPYTFPILIGPAISIPDLLDRFVIDDDCPF